MGTSSTNKSFNWETNDMNKTDENTPYLDQQESFLGELLDPLDQFLNSPKHSADRLYLPGLFQPLCTNQSVSNHRSGDFQPLNQISAWLDDSSQVEGGRRVYSGVMTDGEFLKYLKMKRLGHETLPDARIRRIHIPNPSHNTVSSIICTAPWNQTLALRGFIKRYIRSDGLMNVCILPIDNKDTAFVMEFHFPYLVWRVPAPGSNPKDERRTADGSPLRMTLDMSFLTRTMDTDNDGVSNPLTGYLYEAQSSCVVTGCNNSYWTAISFSDTYFYPGAINNDASICGDNEDMLANYDGDDEDTDPLAIGNFAVQQRALDPRHYFLVIAKNRLEKIKGEWDFILQRLTSAVKNYLKNSHIMSPPGQVTLANTDAHAEAVHESYKWVTGVMYLVEQLQDTMSKLTKACLKFQQCGLVKLTGPEPSMLLRVPIQEIRQCLDELGVIEESLSTVCRKAQVFKEQLLLHMSVAGNYVTVLQQANFTTNATYIFFFGAPTLAASIFQANIFGETLTPLWFFLLTLAIIGLGCIAHQIRDKYILLRIWSLMASGRQPVVDADWGNGPGRPSLWQTRDNSRLWQDRIPRDRCTTVSYGPGKGRRGGGRSNTWSHDGSRTFRRDDDHTVSYPQRTYAGF